MKTILKRIILITLAVAAIAVVGISLRPQPMKVESAKVICGAMRVTVGAEGKTRVRDRFVVAAPVAGRLARIGLRRGDLVERNAAIARIDPMPLAPLDPRQLAESRARVAAAEQLKNEADAVAESTRVECEQARREYARAEKLIETGDVSRQEFERTRNAEQTCRRQLEAAQYRGKAAASEVEVARASLLAVQQAGQSGKAATVIVRSPERGRVLRVLEESERVVMAGAPLMELSTQTLEIVIEVLSADAVKVKPGSPVLIENWGGDRTLQAKVRLIEPSAFTKISALGIEEQRVNVIADFTDAHAPLGDGYRIEAQIIVWEANNVLKTPSNSLFRRGQNWSVFVIENGVARLREIEIGRRNAFEAEVLSGLKEGDDVILHPSNELAEGARVTIDKQ